VHTEVGHHCIGAGSTAGWCPWSSVLENGDVVEVLTSRPTAPARRGTGSRSCEPSRPQQDPQWFTKERREEAIEQGKDAIAK
jgi:GTP pyrophosphokinase